MVLGEAFRAVAGAAVSSIADYLLWNLMNLANRKCHICLYAIDYYELLNSISGITPKNAHI